MRTVVVHCHPLADSFVAAVRDRALAGLGAAGHDVDLLDLYADGWRCEGDDRPAAGEPSDDPVAGHAGRLRAARALVLVYPTWWGGQPAMLKDWLDRVWPVAAGPGPSRPWPWPQGRGGLRGLRRLVAVTTHGSPKWVNAIEGEAGKRVVLRQLRLDCHPLARSTWLALYGVDQSDRARKQAFLDRVGRTMARL